MEKKLNSIEEIDSSLAEEFGNYDDLVDPVDPNEESEEGEKVIEGEEVEETTETTETPVETPTPLVPTPVKEDKKPNSVQKPTKEEQEQYAFAELRRKQREAEDGVTKYNTMFKRLAKVQGYKNADEYVAALEKSLKEKEAESQNIPLEYLEKYQQLEKEYNQLKTQKETEERATRSQQFLSVVEREIKAVGSEDPELKTAIFNKLEELKYDLDTLLTLPKPEYLIRGILNEIKPVAPATPTVEEPVATQVETTKIDQGGGKTTRTIDEIIDDEMKIYAKQRGLVYDPQKK